MIDKLREFGINIMAGVIAAVIHEKFSKKHDRSTLNEPKDELKPNIQVDNAEMISAKPINALAEHGDITIQGSYVFAPKEIKYQSYAGTKIEMRLRTKSQTDGTLISAGNGKVKAVNGAIIEQSEKGILLKA